MGTRAHIETKGLIRKPLLAARLDDNKLEDLKYPVGVTKKIDGIRALMIDGQLVSRTFKPIPNKHLQAITKGLIPNGMDMEITVEGGSFQESTGGCMRESGEPTFHIWIIDYVKDSLTEPYLSRIGEAIAHAGKHWNGKPFVWTGLYPQVVENAKQLQGIEEDALAMGYEGVMVRDMYGPYKCGRATFKEGILTKIKRFEDCEAEVIKVLEQDHNENAADKDAFGRTKRSTKQENMKPAGTLGSFMVKGINGTYKGIEFRVGTGFTQAQRDELWSNKGALPGKIVKVRYFPTGVKTAPRFPVWLGFRSEQDM
jgi:DNA ligase-1